MKVYSFFSKYKHRIAITSLIGFFSLSIICMLVLVSLLQNLPSPEEIDNRRVNQSTKIYDREGKVLLYEISSGQRRSVILFDEIPQHLKDATIVTEDENFYSQPGFDWKAIIRATIANIKTGELAQGGSTITQQLAKNAFLSKEKTFTRKIKEFLLAARLNRHYTKNEILGLYLNEIDYGPTAAGIEAAARAYFNKQAKNVTIAEAAILAAIPQAPTRYSPWGTHLDELFSRQKMILGKMLSLNKISQEEFSVASLEKISFQPRGLGIKAPHFSLAVQDYLVKKYGEELVRVGGLVVNTTLDWKLQEEAEKIVLEGATQNEKLYKGKNAALFAEDPKTGQILVLVGSKNYFDIENQGNFNVALQGLRQPGSALKPFAYLTAFKKGLIPETVVFDVPTEFAANRPDCPPLPDFTKDNPKCFHPQNFDLDFQGPVSLRTALGQSMNVPAVKVLYLAGTEDTISTLKDFGITTIEDSSRTGLSLVLGGGEIKPIELLGAYATLAQEGIRREQTMILEVKDSDGVILESYQENSFRAIDPEYVKMINDILSDTETRSGLFGGSLPLTIFQGHDVALKTGTTNNYRDAWAFGYTPSLAIGVWAGNNDNTPMQRKGSSLLAAIPMWSKFMSVALKDRPFEELAGTEQNVVPTKKMVGGEWLGPDGAHSILFYVDRKDPLGLQPQDPYNDPQFSNWEFGVAEWLKQKSIIIPSLLTSSTTPTSTTFSPAPTVSIQSPNQNSSLGSEGVILMANITAQSSIPRIVVLWNGELVREFLGSFPNEYSFSFLFQPTAVTSKNNLDLIVYDSRGFLTKSSVVVNR